MTTLAGSADKSGSLDGIGSAARFDTPRGLAFDSEGTILVADSAACTIRKVTPQGVVTTFAGASARSGSADGNANDARFAEPTSVAVDINGNVWEMADDGLVRGGAYNCRDSATLHECTFSIEPSRVALYALPARSR